MSGKRMHKRTCKDGSFRLRFYHAHGDHVDTIEAALARARSELGTDFDVVALEAICMNYMSGGYVTMK